MNNLPIGVFDSGIGGLTVLKELIRQLPKESFIYLGDTARVPYGNRDNQTIKRFSLELVNFLLAKKVKALVVACNTMSAVSLGEIKEISTVPVIDVISPTVKLVSEKSLGGVGLIATRATINCKAYDKEFAKYGLKIKSKTVPLLVPIIEEGLNNAEIARTAVKMYLKGFKVKTLILGSTHYPLVSKIIQEVLGTSVQLINCGVPTAKALKDMLQDKDLLSQNRKPSYELIVTDDTKKTEEIANLFFDNKLPVKLKKVRI